MLSNDDGIEAPGLHALEDLFGPRASVVVVAPHSEQSAKSHALTMWEPLRAHRRGPHRYAVTGTPADCAYIGLHKLCDPRPDVVISGVNRGSNIGDDVHYSGTVAAAMEAALIGVPALAVSLGLLRDVADRQHHWATAAAIALDVVQRMLADPLDKHCFLNLNVPDLPLEEVRGIKICRMGRQSYHPLVDEKRDPRGKPYYWIGGDHKGWSEDEESDGCWFGRGYATLTPLQPDLTAERQLDRLRGWGLSLERP
jgi:5'-nucleotidase